MDPTTILEKFKSREFNPNHGETQKTLADFNSIEEVAASLKEEESINSYQLISRVLYLTGVPKERATLAALALSTFVSEGHLPDLTSLVGLPIGLIMVACGHHGDYDDLVPPVPVVSLDQGRTWLGFDGGNVESYPLKTWIARRFHELCSLMPLYPNEDRYKHDFRSWALFEPTATGFQVKPGSVHRVGRRPIDDDVKQFKKAIEILEKADHVKPVQEVRIEIVVMNVPPPFVISGQQTIPSSRPPSRGTAPFIIPGQQMVTRQIVARNAETGEPPVKKARKE